MARQVETNIGKYAGVRCQQLEGGAEAVNSWVSSPAWYKNRYETMNIVKSKCASKAYPAFTKVVTVTRHPITVDASSNL
jgi:hypothetical protein